MTWRAAIGLAVRGLRRRPGRALLTVLSVTLASALLTALLTIAGTAETRVLNELAKGGPLAGIKVAAATPDPAQIGRDDARPGKPKDLDQAAVDQIRALPSVREVIPVVSSRMLVVGSQPGQDGKPLDPFLENVVGVDLNLAHVLPITVTRGRLPAPGSLTEIVVTEGYLERLGLKRTEGDQIIGTELELGAAQAFAEGDHVSARGRWVKDVIVGVVAQEAAEGQLLVSTEQVDLARRWSRAGVPDERFQTSTSAFSGLFVVADGLDQVGLARNQITAIGYSTSAPENLIASVRRYLHVVEIVLTSVGAIALVVAALGISNAMLAAVRERRREIGVLKAIGGRDRDIRRIFLVEAGVLGFTGGLLGAGAGTLIARGVGAIVNTYLVEQGLVGVELELPILTMVGAIVGATVLAVLAGTIPAVRASHLQPREAVGAA